MTAEKKGTHAWIEALPEIAGRYSQDADLSKTVWFRVGGAADVLFKPKNVADLQAFMRQRSKEIPLTVLGAGSNVLIRDGGIPGVVIKLGRGFAEVTVDGDEIEAGAACLDRTVALTCQEAGIGGLEFLVGIPGAIGGAVKMNAGAYGGEIKDHLIWAEAIDPNGELHRLSSEDLGFAYRTSSLADGWIVTKVRLKGEKKPVAEVAQIIERNLQAREDTQPVRGRTGGSTFKNPPGQKAWQLIDEAGCRGMQIGDAQVSEKHCNFFLNLGAASAYDLEALGEEVRRKVLENSKTKLEWEIKRLGEFASDTPKLKTLEDQQG